MPTPAKKAAKKKAAPKKAAAKKTTAKKATAKKTTTKKAAKKTVAKKSTAKKTTAKKTTAAKPMAKAATKPAAKAPKATKPAAPKKSAGTSTTASAPSALAIGKKVPTFSLQSTTGETISLSDFTGRNHVVLYFYPKDDTPGCTIEACSFRDRIREMEDLGAVVLGVSPDDVASHAKFTNKYSLNFPLLADVGANIAKKYEVWKEKNMYGNKSMGIERSTFLIDKEGNLARVWRRVKVEGHDDEVIEALQELEPADTWNR